VLAPPLHFHEEHDRAERLRLFFQTTGMPTPQDDLRAPHAQGIWTHLWAVCSTFDFTAHFIFTGAATSSHPAQNENVEIKQEGSFGEGFLLRSQIRSTEQRTTKLILPSLHT